jgi:hypothetical protein
MKRLFERLIWTDHLGKRRLGKVRDHTAPIKSRGFHCFGVLFNPHALWVGGHYSSWHRRVCINLIPCLTLWWCGPRGELP